MSARFLFLKLFRKFCTISGAPAILFRKLSPRFDAACCFAYTVSITVPQVFPKSFRKLA